MKISCKKCNAPLSLLGNVQRSRLLICEYCGTVMDTRDDFKALYAFTHGQQNNTIRIGQPYIFQGIDFTVTGFITYASQVSQWQEYQLYSVTHGYAKLLEKDGKTVFLRKTHYLPKPNIWLLCSSDSFKLKDEIFKIASFEFTEIYYACGSIIDNIKQRKRSKQCFAKSENQWFQSIYKRNSVDYYIGHETNLF